MSSRAARNSRRYRLLRRRSFADRRRQQASRREATTLFDPPIAVAPAVKAASGEPKPNRCSIGPSIRSFAACIRCGTPRRRAIWTSCGRRILCRRQRGQDQRRGHADLALTGKPAYDPASVFAEYKGAMKDGRAEGEGSYFDKAGITYKGGWRNGLMDGFGRLTLPNGDEYVGQCGPVRRTGPVATLT